MCLSIGRYTSDMPAHVVDSLISSALAVWGRASQLTFVRSYSDKADIMVEFNYGGTNLGQATSPGLKGHMTFLKTDIPPAHLCLSQPQSMAIPSRSTAQEVHWLMPLGLVRGLVETFTLTMMNTGQRDQKVAPLNSHFRWSIEPHREDS